MELNSNLSSCFSYLDDQGIGRTKRYPLLKIIFLSILATISGCEGWKAISGMHCKY